MHSGTVHIISPGYNNSLAKKEKICENKSKNTYETAPEKQILDHHMQMLKNP